MYPQNSPDPDETVDDTPPILGTWSNVYTLVLLLHLVLILTFYFFSRAYA